MRWRASKSIRLYLVAELVGLIAAAATCGIARRPWGASVACITLVCLSLSVVPLVQAWRDILGTALRPTIVWAFVVLAIGIGAQLVAIAEQASTGRPVASQCVYVMSVSGVAGLLSLLNARRPGSGAWAWLMALLVVFFLIPWLEGGSLATGVDPESLLKLDMPWSLFYFVVVVTGLANHLPTRFAPGGLVLGCGYAGVFLALIQGVSSSAGQWAWNLFPLVTCAAVWLVCVLPAPPAQRSAFDRVWAWFRDRWGLVWAVRVQERFNREARVAAWPVTLTWHGLVPHSGASETVDSETLEAATKSLKSLLRRFAEPGALERAAAHDAPDSIT